MFCFIYVAITFTPTNNKIVLAHARLGVPRQICFILQFSYLPHAIIPKSKKDAKTRARIDSSQQLLSAVYVYSKPIPHFAEVNSEGH